MGARMGNGAYVPGAMSTDDIFETNSELSRTES